MTPSEFIATLVPIAVSEQKRTSVLASITLAQAALESAWGNAAPGNNLFGIKGTGKEQETQEYENGYFVTVTAGFRVYDSWDGSVIDHSNFLVENGRYEKAGFFEACLNLDYAYAATALQNAGYATDPYYASKLCTIIRSNKLDQYDKEEPDMTAEQANYIIDRWIAKDYELASEDDKKKRHELANALRVASGQPEQ